MNKLKTVVATIIITMCLCIPTYAAIDAFTDQNTFGDWYADAANDLRDQGIITGYPDGSFQPENTINRAELAVIIKRLDDLQNQKLLALIEAYDGLSDRDIVSWVKAPLVIARAGLAPELGQLTMEDISDHGYGDHQYRIPLELGENRGYEVDNDPNSVVISPVTHQDMPTYWDVYMETCVDDYPGENMILSGVDIKHPRAFVHFKPTNTFYGPLGE